MNATTGAGRLPRNERETAKAFMLWIVYFLTMAILFLVVPPVLNFFDADKDTTAYQVAKHLGMAQGWMYMTLFVFVVFLQARILGLQRRIAKLEKSMEARL